MIKWKEGQHWKVTLLVLSGLVTKGQGHGRLMEPPNRSSLWRLKEFESDLPDKNYDDNQLWCGGMGSQYTLSGGKCGPCGDEYLKPRPRENEHGGIYGRGIITRKYSPGQSIPIGVELTVNHLGYFVFSLCPIQKNPNDLMTLEEEECFDQYPLALTDGTGTKFLVKTNNTGYYKTTVDLPNDLTCKRCVLRWHYRTGNRWNYVNNETGALGIGDQEIFRGCSDITIGSFPAEAVTPSTVTTLRPSINTTTLPESSSQRPRPFPTQRPPAAILPAAPTQPSTGTTTSLGQPALNSSIPTVRPPSSSSTTPTASPQSSSSQNPTVSQDSTSSPIATVLPQSTSSAMTTVLPQSSLDSIPTTVSSQVISSTLSMVSPVVSSSSAIPVISNHHPHPVMHPPTKPLATTTKEPSPPAKKTIILSTLFGNSL